MHLDVYGQKYNVNMNKGFKPDLIGLDLNLNWLVVEAKGRSNRFDKKILKEAKQQTRTIRKIDGEFPYLRVAIESYFSADALSVYLDDPYEYDEDSIDLDIKKEKFIYSYYQVIIDLLQYNQNILEKIELDENTYVVFLLHDLDIKIGLNEMIYNKLI